MQPNKNELKNWIKNLVKFSYILKVDIYDIFKLQKK